MQLYSLEVDDFSNDDYHLIGIHTTLEDYRLAFLLNKFFNISLKKASYELDVKNKYYNSFYSVFEYNNKELDYDWFLITNAYKAIIKSVNSGLFSESERMTHLLPERKKIDYFLKIEGDVDSIYLKNSIEKINHIPQIIASYKIETNTLKSKDSLIF